MKQDPARNGEIGPVGIGRRSRWAGRAIWPRWRDSTGRPTPIDARHRYHPVLDAFLRALPFAYRGVADPEGSTVTVEVAGDAGGTWSIRREADAWSPIDAAPDPPTATVTVDQAGAWLLFTQRIDRATAHAWFPTIRVAGDSPSGTLRPVRQFKTS